MATVQLLKKNLIALKGTETELAIKSINENEQAALTMVRAQLAEGIQSDGNKSVFQYKPLTIAIKKTKTGLASVTDHLTNFDTGESYRRLYMQADSSQVEFGTKTEKEDAISERMDGFAFRLTIENKNDFIRENAFITFIKYIKDRLKL